MFFNKQQEKYRREYTDLLSVVGSLSNLFAESSIPYLYYRAAENIFCKAFEAENLSRGDVSADATKNKLGIGLKTFLHKNGRTFQKIAEFNRGAFDYQSLETRDLVETISRQRNERINFTKRAHDLEEMIYHIVTREEGIFSIFEENMDLIDLSNVQGIKEKGNIIQFRDNLHEYKFNKSKSTLEKRFTTLWPLHRFQIQIKKDPYSFLIDATNTQLDLVSETAMSYLSKELEHVYLPLYSTRDGEVHRSSGLNQWNAGGRTRHQDELYIPIPKWIHGYFEGFFPYSLDHYDEARRNGERYTSPTFILELPNGKKLFAKVCQENGKALMSNPNRELGNWLLRQVLRIKPQTLASYSMLENVGVDSVIVSKKSSSHFRIDFAALGSYADFEDEYRI